MNNLKICTTCKVEQPYTSFFKNKETKDGYRPDCKSCRKIYQLNNKNKIKDQKRKYYLNNHRCVRDKTKKYYEENKERASYVKKLWHERNPQRYLEKSKERARYLRGTNVSYKINGSMSASINKHLRINKTNKYGSSWIKIVNYTVEDLKSHLESKFIDDMSWENYGLYGWHIDHIIPKSFFKFDSYDHPAFKACWSLENLQPLWAKDNLKKNNKVVLTKEQQELVDKVNYNV